VIWHSRRPAVERLEARALHRVLRHLAEVAPARFLHDLEQHVKFGARRLRHDLCLPVVDLPAAREPQGEPQVWVQELGAAHHAFVSPATLAIMNNHDIADQPRPGERLKIVVAG
jgi:hypothetical protein